MKLKNPEHTETDSSKDESFYIQLNEEIERKQNILSALNKILQSYESDLPVHKRKTDHSFLRLFAKKN